MLELTSKIAYIFLRKSLEHLRKRKSRKSRRGRTQLASVSTISSICGALTSSVTLRSQDISILPNWYKEMSQLMSRRSVWAVASPWFKTWSWICIVGALSISKKLRQTRSRSGWWRSQEKFYMQMIRSKTLLWVAILPSVFKNIERPQRLQLLHHLEDINWLLSLLLPHLKNLWLINRLQMSEAGPWMNALQSLWSWCSSRASAAHLDPAISSHQQVKANVSLGTPAPPKSSMECGYKINSIIKELIWKLLKNQIILFHN